MLNELDLSLVLRKVNETIIKDLEAHYGAKIAQLEASIELLENRINELEKKENTNYLLKKAHLLIKYYESNI